VGPGARESQSRLAEYIAEKSVLTGHVHNYQRFSAPLYNKKSVPFIVV
jgi:hypothetical protein